MARRTGRAKPMTAKALLITTSEKENYQEVSMR